MIAGGRGGMRSHSRARSARAAGRRGRAGDVEVGAHLRRLGDGGAELRGGGGERLGLGEIGGARVARDVDVGHHRLARAGGRAREAGAGEGDPASVAAFHGAAYWQTSAAAYDPRWRACTSCRRGTTTGSCICVVESPRGSKAKFKYDPAHGVFMLSRSLILGVNYPYDWGFIPSTMAPDGDPLDVMIFHDTPTYPGVVMECEVIGALLVTQKRSKGRGGREPNHRLFAVPAGSERQSTSTDARKLPRRVRKELESFFIAVGLLANKS